MNDKPVHDFPERLASQVFGDLRPVTPIRSASIRTLAVAGVALAAAAISIALIGMRVDQTTLPSGVLATMIALRVAAGLTLILLALREVVPALPRWPGFRTVAICFSFAVLLLSPHVLVWITGPLADAPGPRFLSLIHI